MTLYHGNSTFTYSYTCIKENGLACFMCTICCLIVNPLAPELIPGVICRKHKLKLQDLIFSCMLLHTKQTYI